MTNATSTPASPGARADTRRGGPWKRLLPPIFTLLIFLFIFKRIPFPKLVDALRSADYQRFLLLMIPNTLFYFLWDTLVLTVVIRWFHGPVRYRELLPVRAASYVVALFNNNAARGALAIYLSRRLRAPFLQIGSTVIFLLLTEYTHLVAWATLGILGFRSDATRQLLWVPPTVALFWLVFLLYARMGVTPSRVIRWLLTLREWSLFRTFRLAPLRRYPQIVLLRAPMFFVSLWIHYLAVQTFGIHIPFGQMLTFLPVIFMLAAMPVTVAHLGTTQAAWIFFFGHYASGSQLLAYSLASHLAFVASRGLLGLVFLPRAYQDLSEPLRSQPFLSVSPPTRTSSQGE